MGERAEDRSRMVAFLPGFLRGTLPLALVLSLLTPGLMAADPAQASGRNRGQGRDADFLFSAPNGFFGFRLGRFFPRAEGELFDFVTDELTLEKNDFRAWNIGFDAGADLHEQFELVISMDFMTRSKMSEFRDYVDEQDLPIVQETRYAQLPLTAGVKYLLLPRGRQVGQYAWLPSRFVPYLGAGAGILWYRFEQEGDFVDFDTLDIFEAELRSSGWTPTAYLGGGLDINIFRHTYLNLDLRYSWARPELGGDYVGFDELRLDGLRASAGLQWHF
ncbi:MAG: hypothetical protein JW793_15690 [Acidobacteria bacterium]|nr:hypothetical protein [Acidobacteriota bacterium]